METSYYATMLESGKSIEHNYSKALKYFEM